MNEHYFTREPASPHRPAEVVFEWRDVRLRLHTDRGMFSYRRIDPGTRLLATQFVPDGPGRVADLGAGYGALGLMLAARFPDLSMVMVEINQRAARLCRANAARNGLRAQVLVGDGLAALGPGSLDAVVTNPPVRAGRSVIYRWMQQAAQALRPGGTFWMVVRTRQGAASLARAVEARIGPVELMERGGGYRVFRARKSGPAP
ncbi:class I SAM-dependent methyltransferase [Geochorda subterranea]|uniref:Methyltransferase n=1 Tax=Geochorda subterranea TaxID=3109564 RepID=A0ABZ1BRC5_9FIRM|nr:methyltransferase [Limnochorda sp. LNt]WRP15355.1 methyltransferase [Limnochorda sp. LNt]